MSKMRLSHAEKLDTYWIFPIMWHSTSWYTLKCITSFWYLKTVNSKQKTSLLLDIRFCVPWIVYCNPVLWPSSQSVLSLTLWCSVRAVFGSSWVRLFQVACITDWPKVFSMCKLSFQWPCMPKSINLCDGTVFKLDRFYWLLLSHNKKILIFNSYQNILFHFHRNQLCKYKCMIP